MSQLSKAFEASGYNASELKNFISLLLIAEQEKDGKEIKEPTFADINNKILEIEKASESLDLAASLETVKKKSTAIKLQISSECIHALISDNDPSVKALLEFNNLCQAKLMRPAGTERQQLPQDDKLEPFREHITTALICLGYISETKPKNKNPDALLILGASQASFTGRLDEVLKCLDEEKVQPGAIYLLGGQRPLWAADEPVLAELLAEKLKVKDIAQSSDEIQGYFLKEKVTQVSDTTNSKEIEAFRHKMIAEFTDKYNIQWPTELDMMLRVSQKKGLDNKGLTVVAVDTPMQPNEKGDLVVRPETIHTVLSFKTHHATKITPNPGKKISILAFSSQPHISYQDKPIRCVLDPEHFDVEVVGKGISDLSKYKMREAFDAMARSIFSALPMSLKNLAKLDKKQVYKFSC
jgi:hypothetical protein